LAFLYLALNMDENLVLCYWTVGGGVFLAVIGALFGGLAGFLARLHGRSPGGYLGLRVLRAVERMQRQEIAPLPAGVLIGAIDGAAFLGTVGVLLGWIASRSQSLPTATLLAIFLGIAGIAVMAAAIGSAAYLISRGGMRAAGAVCGGGFAGICIGIRMAGAPGVMVGACLGLLLGLAIGWLGSRLQSPRKQNTEFEEEEP
jgi:hypothetical protein